MEELEKEKVTFSEMQEWYTECSWKLSKAQADNMELIKELGECKEKLEEGKTNFIKQITDKLGEWLSKILGDRT
jgi:predicted nuclease with TOPRIM domain